MASSSSNYHHHHHLDGIGSSSRALVPAEDGVRVAMRTGDGCGLVDSHRAGLSSNNEVESGRLSRRSGRRESLGVVDSSAVAGGGSGGRGGRNGYSSNGATSLKSMRVEPATRARRQPAKTEDRVSKRRRPGPGRSSGSNVDTVPNGFHQGGHAGTSAGPSEVEKDKGLGSVSGVPGGGMESEEDQVEIVTRERVGEYFPLIPDELGLQCLTRLPRHLIHQMSLVCKRWKEYLLSGELYRARQSHGIKEDWVFLLVSNMGKKWRAFLPNLGEFVVLPSCPCDYTFDSCDKESMVAGLNLLVLGQNQGGYVIWKFDTIESKWSITPKMHSDRCMFGSATFGKYAYFAGGSSHATVLKAAERYNSETNSWEKLADMNHHRKGSSGFVMDGKFHVIGGHLESGIDSFDSSGESYDAQTEEWTLIEGMWPRAFVPTASSSVSPPLVAVLNNQLYAVNVPMNMLMLYIREDNVWRNLDEVPFKAENSNGWGLAFKAVGNELIFIGGGRGNIHAYRPPMADGGGGTWRFVTDLKFPTNGFIYNCAVMSG